MDNAGVDLSANQNVNQEHQSSVQLVDRSLVCISNPNRAYVVKDFLELAYGLRQREVGTHFSGSAYEQMQDLANAEHGHDIEIVDKMGGVHHFHSFLIESHCTGIAAKIHTLRLSSTSPIRLPLDDEHPRCIVMFREHLYYGYYRTPEDDELEGHHPALWHLKMYLLAQKLGYTRLQSTALRKIQDILLDGMSNSDFVGITASIYQDCVNPADELRALLAMYVILSTEQSCAMLWQRGLSTIPGFPNDFTRMFMLKAVLCQHGWLPASGPGQQSISAVPIAEGITQTMDTTKRAPSAQHQTDSASGNEDTVVNNSNYPLKMEVDPQSVDAGSLPSRLFKKDPAMAPFSNLPTSADSTGSASTTIGNPASSSLSTSNSTTQHFRFGIASTTGQSSEGSATPATWSFNASAASQQSAQHKNATTPLYSASTAGQQPASFNTNSTGPANSQHMSQSATSPSNTILATGTNSAQAALDETVRKILRDTTSETSVPKPPVQRNGHIPFTFGGSDANHSPYVAAPQSNSSANIAFNFSAAPGPTQPTPVRKKDDRAKRATFDFSNRST